MSCAGDDGKTGGGQEQTSVELKVPVAFGTHLPSLGDGILYIADRLETMSGGSLSMTVFEPNELVAPNEILDAVSSGKTNAGYATAGYWVGKLPAAPLFSAVPFGPDAAEYLAWLYYDDGMDLYQQMYDDAGYNVHVLLAAIIPPETSGWFAEPIESTSDLDGLRMRFFGLGAVVMQKFGVQTSLLPGGEIFAALEKGAIDATEFSLPVVDQRLGFHKLVKHNYYPGWHQQATTFELLINKDVWNGLSDQQRMILDVICKASVADSFAHGEAIEGAEIKKNVTEYGVTNHYWSEEMLTAYENAWLEVVEEKKAEDAFFAEVWADFSAFDAEYKYWSSIGYLPRPPAPK
ncbi:MAG: C4-dicarboxylate ABC transporter [Dehalococcoidales bacterium]|nr:C4-dicarboxylate ABC transporter [Dehalococcoidales bacterium]